MASIWPGATACAAGAVTCASTLPMATAMPSGSPVQPARLGGQRPGPAPSAESGTPARRVCAKSAKSGLQHREVVRGRVVAVLVDPLVAGGAGVARLHAAQLPDDPVGRLDPPLGAPVDVRVLLEQLQRLGELPLRGDPPAVAADPGLAARVGEGVDPVGLRLGGVVLPQLRPGVRAVAQLGELAQRRAVAQDGQHGAGGEVGADADDVGGVDAGVAHRLPDRGAEHGAPVLRVLQRPVRRQRASRCPAARARSTPCAYSSTAVPSSAPSLTRTTTARADSVPKSTPTTSWPAVLSAVTSPRLP